MPSPWIIHRYGTVASTMDQADHLARFGARDRSAVVCDEQTAGRGRAGRRWHAPNGSALLCTLLLRPDVPPARLPILSLVTGIAVAEAIEAATGHAARLKWPNDVWLGADPERPKVAGILLTSRLGRHGIDVVLIGIGINLTSGPDTLPPGATSLLRATGSRLLSAELLPLLLERFDCRYAKYLEGDGVASLDDWRARAALLGEGVTLLEGDRMLHGVYRGVDDDGALILQDAGGAVHRVVAGELTRGPRALPQPR